MFPASLCSIVSRSLILCGGPCCSLLFVFHYLQMGLLRGQGWAESSQSVRFGREHDREFTQVTSTTNSSQQLEARGFLSWHRVRTLCTDRGCSGLKLGVTGKPEPAQPLVAPSVSGLQQSCFLPSVTGQILALPILCE